MNWPSNRTGLLAAAGAELLVVARRVASFSQWPALLFLMVVGVASLRVARTYHFYNHSFDEPAHVNCGLEWLGQGTYTAEPQHPPLARILMALGPYLRGARFDPKKRTLNESNRVFQECGDYWDCLSSARVATLFWFLLACTSLYLFAGQWCAKGVALRAVFLFSLVPAVLTHAGMATNDMAATAGLMLVFYSFSRYWGEATFIHAALSGLSLAVAIGSKLSLVLFVTVATVPFALALGPPWKWTKGQWRRGLAHGAVFVSVTLFLLFALYGFELTPVARLGNLPVPLHALKAGLQHLVEHNKEGHDAVFLGVYGRKGFPTFFPFMLLVKTPLGILALILAGYVGLLFRWRDWPVPVRIAFGIAPMVVAACMAASISIGLRHVLPVYPFLALSGALSLVMVSRRIPQVALRAVLGAALLAGCLESATAITDPLPWFNLLAPEPRDLITVDSDLDWGQNLYRLSQYLKEEKIEQFSLRYFGTGPFELFDFPKGVREVSEDGPMEGYVVVSAYVRRLECLKRRKYCWLGAFEPEYSIGDGIHIYYLPRGIGGER